MRLDDCLTSFENQRVFNTLKQQRDAVINNLYENDWKKCFKTGTTDSSITNPIITSTIKTDNNWDDNIIANDNINKNNQLNYRYQKVYQDGTDKTGFYTNTLFRNNIKDKERHHTSIQLNENNHFQSNQHPFECNMGSNVSRNTAKGLSGRRTQSSGEFRSFCSRSHSFSLSLTLSHSRNYDS